MVIHHMQLNNIDMCFVTKIWTHGNEPEYQYIKANLETAGYKILKVEKTEKEEELQ